MPNYTATLAALGEPQQFLYTPPQAPAPISRWALLGQVFYFLLVFAFVVGLTYLMTRFLANRTRPLRRSRHLRILDQLGLAPGKTVHLVDCHDRIFILGSGEKDITLLGEITDPVQLEALRGGADDGGVGTPGFEDYLQSSLHRQVEDEVTGPSNALSSAQHNVEALLRRTQGIFKNGRISR